MFSIVPRFTIQLCFIAMCIACGNAGTKSDTASEGGVITRPPSSVKGAPANPAKKAEDGTQATDELDTHDERWLLQLRAAPKIHAYDLLEIYKKNQVDGDERYKGKIIAVEGKIREVGKDLAKNSYIAFESGERYDIFAVQAFFTAKSESTLSNLRPGHRVWVVGRCAGKTLNVHIVSCQLVEEREFTRQTPSELAEAARQKDAATAAEAVRAKAEAERLERERPAREKAEKERLAQAAIEARTKNEAQAATALDFVKKNLSSPDKVFQLHAQLNSIIMRFPGTPAAIEAETILKSKR